MGYALGVFLNQVDDGGQAQDVFIHCPFASRLAHIEPVILRRQKQIDKLPLPAFDDPVILLDPMHDLRRLPVHKEGAVMQGAAGPTLELGDIDP